MKGFGWSGQEKTIFRRNSARNAFASWMGLWDPHSDGQPLNLNLLAGGQFGSVCGAQRGLKNASAKILVPMLLILWSCLSGHAEIIDRLVAVVNRQVITLGDVQRAIKNEELGTDVPGTENDKAQKRRLTEDMAIQRLIEQALVFQQIQEFPGTEVLATEVTAQISEMQRKAGGPERWNHQLKDLNLELDEVIDHVKWQLQVMKFIDYRFRQFVVVDQGEIESYYQKQLLPDLQKRGIREEPVLAEVEEKIRSILIEEKLNLQVDEWLASLRTTATIQIFH